MSWFVFCFSFQIHLLDYRDDHGSCSGFICNKDSPQNIYIYIYIYIYRKNSLNFWVNGDVYFLTFMQLIKSSW